MASICCSPPESVPARWLRRSSSRGKAWKTSERGRTDSGRLIPRPARLKVLLATSAMWRFSWTVRFGKMRRSSGTSPSPFIVTSSAAMPVMSSPANRMLPRRTSGGTAPATALTVVVLPAPLRPRRAQICPSSTDIESSRRMWLSP